MPGAPVFQVKLRPASSAVTFQTAGGKRGWRIRAREPIRSGPWSSTRMPRTDGVHSCQCSASAITDQTTSGGAVISTEISNSILKP